MSSRQRRRNPISAIELRITIIEDRKKSRELPLRLPLARGQLRVTRGREEILVRSKDPLEVIAKARRALDSLRSVASQPKAFKQSRPKLATP